MSGRAADRRPPQPPGRRAWLRAETDRGQSGSPSESSIRVIHPSQSEPPIRVNPSHPSESDRGRLGRAADGARGARRCAAACPPPRRSPSFPGLRHGPNAISESETLTPYPSQNPSINSCGARPASRVSGMDQTQYPSQKPERHIRVRIRPLTAAALAQLPGSPAWTKRNIRVRNRNAISESESVH